jgi:hypothetical protein
MFAPGYYRGNNPELGGRWAARHLATWERPAPEFRYDIGFVQLYDDDGRGCGGSQGGRPIETYTGHLGSDWGGSFTSVHWNQFGYPGDPPFAGEVMVEVDSSTGEVGFFSYYEDTVQVGNDMTVGASGGPWIKNMSPNPTNLSQNLANGLTSFEEPGRPLANGSPEFYRYNYATLLNNAKTIPCP